MRKLYSVNAPYDGLGQQFRLTPFEEWSVNHKSFVDKIGSREEYEMQYAGHKEGRYHRTSLHELYNDSHNVLVLGAGNGFSDFDFYTRYQNNKIILSDVSDSVLQKISGYYGFKAMKIDSRIIDLPDSSQDLVYSLASEYFFDDRDYERMLSEVARVLRAGRPCLISTVCLDEPFDDFSVKGCLLRFLSERPFLWVLLNKLRGINNLKWTGYRRSLEDHYRVFKKVGALRLERIEFDYEDTRLKSTAFLFIKERYGR
ncbi:MAG: class I SAM-dependent methyltransferase [Deltaproteobacteria bacterium]|nr:class I SAM-dependent methyltransferase [Deltaproteobacteria bacterium]